MVLLLHRCAIRFSGRSGGWGEVWDGADGRQIFAVALRRVCVNAIDAAELKVNKVQHSIALGVCCVHHTKSGTADARHIITCLQRVQLTIRH
jgi:hypothetical protein